MARTGPVSGLFWGTGEDPDRVTTHTRQYKSVSAQSLPLAGRGRKVREKKQEVKAVRENKTKAGTAKPGLTRAQKAP